MNRSDLAPRIDHTVLGPRTMPADVDRVVEEATRHGTNVCIPPCYLDRAADFGGTVVTVVGFPQGQHAPETKVDEATRAWEGGADELDAVLNVGRLLAGERDAVESELESVVAAVPVPVKVIIEAPLLTPDQQEVACECARDAGAAYVKTSTGFVEGGATVEDVARMAQYLPVKASGGIGDYETAMAMLEAGAERIGASAGVDILAGAPADD